MYLVSLKQIFSLPVFITGTGIGGFSTIWLGSLDIGTQRAFPHNIILEVFLELGILGFILLTVLIYKPLINVFNKNILIERKRFLIIFLEY